MKNYEKIGDHTIKKFELVSEYAKGWAHKILGYSESAGLIYIDCMCNCGKYYDIIGCDLDALIMRLPSLGHLCRRLSTSKKMRMGRLR